MRNLWVYSLLAFVFVVGAASAETVLLQEDFSTWPTGALTTGSSLTSGWSVIENGLSVTTENATMGGKTVKSTSGSSAGCVRGTWVPVDPTTAAPLRITLYMRMTGSRLEKGAAFKNADNLAGCSAMMYFCPNTSTNAHYRLRNRSNCSPAPTFPNVYGTAENRFEEPYDKDKMNIWELLCDDTQLRVFKNGALVHTIPGPPNATLDNFQAIELGVPVNLPGTTFPRGSDYGSNGDFWYDFVEVAIGPFETPTPTDTPTLTPTPTETPIPISQGLILREDFDDVTTFPQLFAKGWRESVPLTYTTTINVDSDLNGHYAASPPNCLKSAGMSLGEYIIYEWAAPEPSAEKPVMYSFWIRPNLSFKSGGYYVNEKKVAFHTTSLSYIRVGFHSEPMETWGSTNENGEVPLYVRARDQVQAIGETIPATHMVSTGVWHRFAVKLTGAMTEFYADNEKIFETDILQDDLFNQIRVGAPEGQIGTSYFDNIQLEVGYASTGVRESDWASY